MCHVCKYQIKFPCIAKLKKKYFAVYVIDNVFVVVYYDIPVCFSLAHHLVDEIYS